MKTARTVLSIGCLLLCAADVSAIAQEPAPEPAPMRLRQIQPGASIIKDEEGNWVEVPGFTLEKWIETRDRAAELDRAPPPPYSLEQVTITGEHLGPVAELTLKLRIRITADVPKVRVPLQLGTSVIRRPANSANTNSANTNSANTNSANTNSANTNSADSNSADSNSAYVEYSGQKRQYFAVLQGPVDSVQQLEVRMGSPVQTDGGGSRLALALPAAPTRFELTVPVAPVEASVVEGPFVIMKTAQRGPRSTLTLDGTGGDLRLTWRKATAPAAARPFLTSRLTTSIRIGNQVDVTAAAQMTVRSIGGPLSEFDVRLPPGMKLERANPSAELQAQVLRPLSAGPKGTSEVVRITMKTPTAEAVSLELTAALSKVTKGGRFSAIGFEVLGAVQQRGSVNISVEKGWAAEVVKSQGVERAPPGDETEPSSVQYELALGSPRHVLDISISKVQSKVQIEPLYVVYVMRGQMRLEAQLRCTVQGPADTAVPILELNLPGWTVTGVTPERSVETEELDISVANPLILPLSRPNSKSFTLRVQAVRPLDDGAAAEPPQFSFALPIPSGPQSQAGTVVTTRPARLVVAAADDISLTPDMGKLAGLVADTLPGGDIGLPLLQQAPLSYSALTPNGKAEFAADVAYLAQSITAETTISQVDWGTEQISVRQLLRFRIAHVPTRQLIIDLPESMAQPPLRLALDGRQVDYIVLDSEDAAPGRVAARVTLPDPTIADCELTLTYQQALPSELDEEPVVDVPLARPLLNRDDQYHQLTIVCPAGVELSVDEAHWIRRGKANGSGTVYEASSDSGMLQLTARPTQFSSEDSIVLKTWLQSWIHGSLRKDRAVFLVRTSQRQVTIEIPRNASIEQSNLRGAVDGRKARLQVNPAARRVSMELPSSNSEHVVELWYTFSAHSNHALVAAKVVNAGGAGRAFWQLLIPGGEHLVQPPEELTPDMLWRVNGLQPQWQPTMDQAALEKWIGASQQQRPPAGLRCYLFSTFGQIPALEIGVVPQRHLVVVSAAAAMLLGLGLTYVRWLRTPAVLLLLSVGLIASAFFWPASVFIVSLAALLGLGLAGLGAMLRWLRLPTARPPRAAGGSDRSASRVARLDVGSQATTATARAAAMHFPAAESKP